MSTGQTGPAFVVGEACKRHRVSIARECGVFNLDARPRPFLLEGGNLSGAERDL